LLGTRFAQTFQDMVEQQQLYKNETFQAAVYSFFFAAAADLDKDKINAAVAFGMQSSNHETINVMYSQLSQLILDDKNIKEVIAAVSVGAKNPDNYARSKSLELFGILQLKRQGGIQEALAAASANIQSPNEDVRYAALMLLSNIVAKGQGIQEGIAAASKNIQSSSEEDRYAALKIFKALVEKGQSMKEALAVAVVGAKKRSYGMEKMGALELFGALVEQGEGIQEAIVAASANSNSDAYGMPTLFKALVAKGKGFDEAAAAILSLIPNNPDSAEKLFNIMQANPATKPQLKKLQQELQAVTPADEASRKVIEKILAVQL